MEVYDIYKLIDDLATAQEVHAVLRPYKETHPTEIHLSGNKPDLLADLKKGVLGKWIPEIKVYELLRECEENGDQHILYYTPATDVAKRLLSDGEAVAGNLFGNVGLGKSVFP